MARPFKDSRDAREGAETPQVQKDEKIRLLNNSQRDFMIAHEKLENGILKEIWFRKKQMMEFPLKEAKKLLDYFGIIQVSGDAIETISKKKPIGEQIAEMAAQIAALQKENQKLKEKDGTGNTVDI